MSSTLTQALLQCELFRGLSEEEVTPIVALCRVERYGLGETIFAQGDRGNKVYIVKEGHVTLARSVDLRDRLATVRIATLGRGRAFGCCWSALLGDAHGLMSSATCGEKTEVVSMEEPALKRARQHNLSVGFKVLESLAHMLGDRLGVFMELWKNFEIKLPQPRQPRGAHSES